MNYEYLEVLYKENKDILNENDILSVEELDAQITQYVISNMQYDFNIEVDPYKLTASNLETKPTSKLDSGFVVDLDYDSNERLLWISELGCSGWSHPCSTLEEAIDLVKEYIETEII